jgi:hypothetical protein
MAQKSHTSDFMHFATGDNKIVADIALEHLSSKFASSHIHKDAVKNFKISLADMVNNIYEVIPADKNPLRDMLCKETSY